MTNETILTGNADMLSQGAWVQRDQGTDANFRNVSQYWMPKTKSFEEGLQVIAEQKASRVDKLFDVKKLAFNNASGPITVSVDGQDFAPTDWAGRQLCKWLNVPTTMWGFYQSGDVGDTGVLLNAFRNGQSKIEKPKDLLFRTYNDGTLRACMSDSYSIVDNEWYLECLQAFIPGGRLSHFEFADADNFYGNVLIPDNIRSEDDSDYGGMLNVGNSEIGRSMVWQTPSIFRAICMNGCVWGSKSGVMLKKRHRGIVLEDLREAIRINIEKQIPLLTTKIGDLIGTHQYKCTAAIMNIFAHISQQHSLGVELTNAIGTEWMTHSKEKSAFGVIDAVTRAGQNFDADSWMLCDEIGGNILNGIDRWDTFNTRANTLTVEEVQKAFGVSA